MNLSEFLCKIQDLQYEAAVYGSICDHLASVLSSPEGIPIDLGDGHVPHHYISDIADEMADRRDALLDKLSLSDNAEVSGVKFEDFNID